MSDDWYADPLGRAELRRHNGTRWTHEVSTAGVRSTEPSGFPLPRHEPRDAPVEAPLEVSAPVPATTPPAISPAYRAASPRPASYGPEVALGTFGLLIAAGVLAILTGATTLMLSISELSVVSAADQFRCTLLPHCSGSSPDAGATVLGIVLLALGAAFTAGGVGACMARGWGRSTLIVMSAISVLFYTIVYFATRTDGPFQTSGSVVLIPIIWFGLIAGLAVAGGGIGS